MQALRSSSCRLTWLIALLVAVGGSSTSRAADSARSRTLHSEHGILDILNMLSAGLIVGTIEGTLPEGPLTGKLKALADRAANLNDQKMIEALERLYGRVFDTQDIEISRLTLHVDDEPQHFGEGGLRHAMRKLIHFSLSPVPVEGSVRLKYRIQIRGIIVDRETFVRDGHVLLTTRVSGAIPKVTSATLINDARQSGFGAVSQRGYQQTRITNTICAHAPYGHCKIGPVTKIVERVMDKKIDELLCKIERDGRQIAEGGDKYSLFAMSNSFIERVTGGAVRVVLPHPVETTAP